MPDPVSPDFSQLDDFIDTPMGPGLTGGTGVGQSVHPQAPQPAPPAVAPQGNASPISGGATSSGGNSAERARGERLGSEIAAAGIGLGDSQLRSSEPGAAGAGAGASLGGGAPTRASIAPAADPDREGVNAQQDALAAHAAAQGGAPEQAGPDQTRAQSRAGSINETDGL